LDDAEWACDCASAEDPCVHVAAAVIALRRAREGGAALPTARGAPGRIGYRLTRVGGALALERVVVQGEKETLLPATLTAVASGRVEGPSFPRATPTSRSSGTRIEVRGSIDAPAMPRIPAALGRRRAP
jgi:hypothetical protein